MQIFESYAFIIHASLILILSYFFNYISKKTSIPSVLLLIFLGVLIKLEIEYFQGSSINFFPILEILGIVGLVMIVLEAALDLRLSKHKTSIIVKSFFIGLFSIIFQGISLTLTFHYFIDIPIFNSILYSIPLVITSSAIVIPSVNKIEENKKEFLIYESTFSDILGIMFFYFILDYEKYTDMTEYTISIGWKILTTLVISIVTVYLVVFIFQKIKSEIKLFLLITVLLLLYAVGKLFHLSSLLIILMFGLIMRNTDIFLSRFGKKFFDLDVVNNIYQNLHLITLESSFVIRTFFFVIFGVTISLTSLFDINVVLVSLAVLFVLFGFRFILLFIFMRRKFCPALFISPRGLISILLFYAIPEKYISESFEQGILFFVILTTSLIMTSALIRQNKVKKNKEIIDKTFKELNDQIAGD